MPRNPKKLPPEGWGPLSKGARGALGRCRAFQVAEKVGEGVVEPRIEPGGSVPECTPPLPEPETAQDALDDILLVDERNDAISREHFGHRSGSGSHPSLINSRHFLEGMRRLVG